mmetsp:Transcript_17121/g.25568  ORF Transcript_17121/g.25568 Transcript_17121/m.25568 type:complete len:1342 (-) Transcript_17121:106-4131(-)
MSTNATQELLARLTSASASASTPSSPAQANSSSYHTELQKLRDEGDTSFLFLRTIIELTANTNVNVNANANAGINSGQNEELLFHSVLGFRHVMLFRWTKFSHEFKSICRDFMFALGLNIVKQEIIAKQVQHQSQNQNQNHLNTVVVSKTVGNVCLATSAAFWKRCWDELSSASSAHGSSSSSSTAASSAEEQHLMQLMVQTTAVQIHVIQSLAELFQSLESIIVQQPFQQIQQQQQHNTTIANKSATENNALLYMSSRACSFLSSLIGEFSGSSSAAQYNCSLEFHRVAHLAFEQNVGLIDTLRIAMGGMGAFVSTLLSSSPSASASALPSGELSTATITNYTNDKNLMELGSTIVNLTNDVISWDTSGWGTSLSSSAHTNQTSTAGASALVRPPEHWREYLIRPDFLGAVFQVYTAIRNTATVPQDKGLGLVLGQLKHSLRQLLLLLSSITGIVFEDKNQRIAYAGFLVDGCLSVLSIVSTEWSRNSDNNLTMEQIDEMEKETVDFCYMITKLVANFKVEGLCQLPSFENMLAAIATVGDLLLKQNVEELRKAQGDIECVEGYEWREEALNMLLEAVVLLADDYWLLGVRQGNSQDVALGIMGNALSPFYSSYVTSKIEMAKMEEYYLTVNAAEVDEVREEIAGASMEEEMTAASALGRLSMASSLLCLSGLFQRCLPQLESLFNCGSNDVTPDGAALLEEVRLLIVCTCHLLTDDCTGETPIIPERVLDSCSKSSITTSGIKRGTEEYSSNTLLISQMINSLMKVGEVQASRIVTEPHNPNLSPFLAKTLLWFFMRFAPAYILPSSCDYDSSRDTSGGDGILAAFSSKQTCHQAISFCMTLSLHYLCYWPQENQVQESLTALLLALVKRGKGVRELIVNTPSMEHLVNLHIATAAMIHSTNQDVPQNTGLSPEMVLGYKRLPYKCRSQMLTVILIANSEINDPKSESFFNNSLQAAQNSFHALIQAFEEKKVEVENINTKEMVCLCVEFYAGMARSSEMTHPERIPIFITPSLPKLSNLMIYYATEISICEILLRFFRDYTEQFIVMLNREQCLGVFHSSAELLKRYSATQCSSRVIQKAAKKTIEADLEEEQSYNDILCAIQLLLNLGAKDFIDTFTTGETKGVESGEVTEVIFYGLQQILPLMTQGLLHFPTLCKQYFTLVGFMMDSYPKKVGVLPYDLFNGLLDSLLFGMSHTDSFISKSSLEGMAALAREHIETQALSQHLSHNPAIFENCCSRLLNEVIFQAIIWDRLEPAGMALLPLAAVDINKFATVVNTISQQLDLEKQQRLQTAFQRLMQPDVILKVSNGNYGGRNNRLRFKKDFEIFVKDIHSAVLVF